MHSCGDESTIRPTPTVSLSFCDYSVLTADLGTASYILPTLSIPVNTMTYAYAHLFHSDGWHSENPSDFLQLLEDSFSMIPGISDSNKCCRFYLNCKADLDAEYWYEELESNSPIILTSWPTFTKHFHMKWFGVSVSSLLESDSVASVTATQIAHETPTTTTTIQKHINAATPTSLVTTTTLQSLNQIADVQHVTTRPAPVPVQTEVEPTIHTTNSTITTVAQKDNEEGEEEQEGRTEKHEGVRE